MLTDMFCLAFVWIVALGVYKLLGYGIYNTRYYLSYAPAMLCFVFINALMRLYHGNPLYPAMPVSPIEEFRRLVASSFLLHTLIIAFLAFRHDVGAVSRAILIISACGVALLAQPMRDLVRAILARYHVGQIRALFLGEGVAADELKEEYAINRYVGFELVTYSGDLHDVVVFAKEQKLHILVSCQDARLLREEMIEFVKWFHQIVYWPTKEVFPIAGAQTIALGAKGGMELVNQRQLKGLRHEKRLLDTFLAVMIGLVALPFIIVVPILIKVTSKGPVLYKAKRLGKQGRTIYVWKFRSMYADADARLESLLESDPQLKEEFEKDLKLKKDPRVTPLGRFLRKTSIDELPQLWNVICGEMALVGPRPIVEKEIHYYGADYEIFSLVKPGITGLWQVSGRSDTDYVRRVALDKYYVLNWSPWMDIWIVLRTILAVLKMKGSY